MIEDKLEVDQRIRLEAFVQVNMTSHGTSLEGKIAMAEKVAKFIADGKTS